MAKNKESANFRKWRLAGFGFAFGLLYWISDAAVDSIFFNDGNFHELIYNTSIHELWNRLFALCLITAVGVFAQITINRRRHLEDELRKYRNDLEDMVKERTADLTMAVEQLEIESAERRKAAQVMLESERRYRSLFENMGEGLAYCRMLFEDNRPKDFIYLEVNSSFEKLTGLKDVVGKKVTEVVPGIREADPGLFEIYGRTALTGKPERFEMFVTALKMWFSISVYSPEKGFFVAVFDVISERKKAEARLKALNECFLTFGPDSVENINLLVSLCGKFLGGACALYNRLDNKMLCSLGRWNVPPDYNPVDAPEGHICYDIIRNSSDEVSVIRNLPETRYAQSDPNVARCKLQTYIGMAVKFGDAHIGSLCVVYQEDFVPSEDDKRLLGIIASAIGVEEKRKKAEEALAASEKKYRRLHETMVDAFVSVDMTGRITEFNKSYREMLGYSEEELLKLTYADLTPDKWHSFEAKIVEEQVLTKGFSGVYEKEYRKKDGTVFPVELRTFLVKDESGKPVSMWAIVRDITERRKAEQSVTDALALNEAIFDSSPIAILTYDSSGHCLSANSAAAKAAGTTVDKLLPQNYRELESWRASGMASAADAALSSGNAITLDTHIVTTFGKDAWFSCRFVPFDLSGDSLLLVMIVDITERKRAENEINFLASIVRSVPEAVCSVDLQGNIVSWNKGAEKMLGYLPEEVMGRPITMTIPEEVAEQELDHCTGILNREGFFAGYESVRRAKNGTLVPVEITAVALKDEKGAITHYSSIIRDITERKEAGETLLKLYEEKEEEAEVSKALLGMVETLNTSLDERELLRSVVDLAPHYLKFDRLGILLYDDNTKGFTYSRGYGFSPSEEGMLLSRTFRTGDFPAIDKGMKGETVIIEDAAKTDLISKELLDSFGIKSAVIVPISSRGKVVGGIYADYKITRSIENKEVSLLKGLADGIAIALQNSRLYRESVERMMELSGKIETIKTMAQLDKEILSTIDKATILKTATVLINRVIPSERTAILIKEELDYRIVSEWGLGEFLDKTFALSGSHFDSLEKASSSIYIPDISRDDCSYHRAQAALGIKCTLLVPIATKSGITGLIDIGSTRYGRLTPEHLNTAENIASQIAVALENARLYEELQQLLINTITSLASAIDAKSPWTKGHSERVTHYAVKIGKEMGLPDKELDNLRLAGLLHDVGKIGTYDVLLDKPGKFTEKEFAIVKKHPGKGAEILAPIKQLKEILPGVLHHHERMDGKGYPEGLRDEEIPLCARILCVADSFDAMTADRSHRQSPGKEFAISELKRCAGTQFDPGVVEAFLKILGKEK